MKKLTKKTVLGLALIGFLMVPMFALTAVGVSAACSGGAADGVLQTGEECDGVLFVAGKNLCDDYAGYNDTGIAVTCDANCEVVFDACTGVPLGGWGDECAPAGVPTDLKAAIMNVTNWILGFVAIIATLIVIYGGVLYLTAAGNEEAVEKGKKTISYGIIGIVICGLAYAIVIVVSTVILSA